MENSKLDAKSKDASLLQNFVTVYTNSPAKDST